MALATKLACLALMLVACTPSSPSSADSGASAVAATPDAAPDAGRTKKDVYDATMAAKTLPEALAAAAPLYEDRQALSLGSLTVRQWAESHLTWTDVDGQEVTILDVAQDPKASFAKRLCIMGKVEFGMRQEDGGLSDAEIHGHDGATYMLLPVRSIRKVRDRSQVRFCGLSMGIEQLPGDRPSLVVLGMFDLPENHAAP